MLRNILSAGLINLLVSGVDMARYRDKKQIQKGEWEEASVSSFLPARGEISRILERFKFHVLQ